MKNIIKNFPIFNSEKHPNSLIYLDNAATTQKPQSVINAINHYYSNYNANIHRSVYKIADKATHEYESARSKVADFINARSSKSVIFTSGATEAINLVAYSWGNKFLSKGDEILITEMEHHSNNVPWQIIADQTESKLKYIPLDLNGNLDFKNINSLLTSKTKIVSIIHQSNVFGTINNLDKIINKAHSLGALVLVDAAQSIPHISVDVQKLDCDFLVFSGHKMLGPTGIGVLYGKEEILSGMDPFMGGGQMISNVSMETVTYNELPWKFEAGTPNIAQAIGLGSAIDFITKIGIENINKRCTELRDYAYLELKKINNIVVYGDNNDKGPVISFNIKNINSHDLAQLLDQFGVCIRSGHHCCEPIMKKLKISSTARISLYFYNNKNDIDKLIYGVNKSIDLLI